MLSQKKVKFAEDYLSARLEQVPILVMEQGIELVGLALPQVAERFFPDRSRRFALRVIHGVTGDAAPKVAVFDNIKLLSPPRTYANPLCVWEPGQEEIDYQALAKQLRPRMSTSSSCKVIYNKQARDNLIVARKTQQSSFVNLDSSEEVVKLRTRLIHIAAIYLSLLRNVRSASHVADLDFALNPSYTSYEWLAEEYQLAPRHNTNHDESRMRQIARDGLEIADNTELGELALSLAAAEALGEVVYEAYGDRILHETWHEALAEEERRIEKSP